jgi:hypothetical protein
VTFHSSWSRPGFSLLAVVLAGVLLQGCAGGEVSGLGGNRVFSADMTGAAKSCSAPRPTVRNGQQTEVTMVLGNDGGWCAITTAQANSSAFSAGLLTERPAHGKVFIHQVNGATRIDYTPDRGFRGSDSFAVKLIPGEPVIKAAVTVNAP